MAALILKRFDTYPPVSAQLSDSNGVINLSAATGVKFIMKGVTTSTLVTGACTVTDAVNGKVQYAWRSNGADTAVADTYQVEFEIAWAGGTQTVPNAISADLQIEIDADLENV